MKKHILCLGDSNTHGYCADPKDCADGGIRFNESERWTCLLQQKLGEEYLVIEEGLSGRTTSFEDPTFEGMSALNYIHPCLKSHEPISLLIIMLGTNDTKDLFNANAAAIAFGMARLVKKAKACECWGDKKPNILVIAPPPVGEEIRFSPVDPVMGANCIKKSQELAHHYKLQCDLLGCHFMDANGCEFNEIDYMHLTRKGHAMLAERIAAVIPQLVK